MGWRGCGNVVVAPFLFASLGLTISTKVKLNCCVISAGEIGLFAVSTAGVHAADAGDHVDACSV